ncbi:MAG: Spy/CpxP family protein refolding chaperone [Desulfuromonadaceae bacterium]|nr:Spy/CpxP family protein refolding chaperone [Desulfuromonadaceae bacterium]
MARKRMVFMSLIGLLALSGSAQAMPGAGCFAGPPPDFGVRGPHPPGPPPHFEALLSLSPEQEKASDEIRQQEQERSRPLLEALHKEHATLKTLVDADRFDEAAVREIAGRIAGLETELTVCRMQSRFRLHELLTDDQRACLKQVAEQGGPPPRPPRREGPPPAPGDH